MQGMDPGLRAWGPSNCLLLVSDVALAIPRCRACGKSPGSYDGRLMPKRFRMYFESSVWRRLVDSHSPRRTLTYRLLTIARWRHVILSSRGVVEELDGIPDNALRKQALDRFWRTDPTLITTRPWIRRIARELLQRGGWGEARLADMLHIGYAIVGEADILVTWDTKDLAREKTRRLVAALGRQEGFETPDIATPAEVLVEWLGTKIL